MRSSTTRQHGPMIVYIDGFSFYYGAVKGTQNLTVKFAKRVPSRLMPLVEGDSG